MVSICKVEKKFHWKELLPIFRKEFGDKQARQAALEIVSRMEQGFHQYFQDFLKDFEYRVSQSGGSETYTDTNKTMLLKVSLNSRLRRALVSVKLPPACNYTEWVNEVKDVAAELEGLNDYRPRGATQTENVLGAPKSGSAPLSDNNHSCRKEPLADFEGDTVMTRTNALLAALRDFTNSTKELRTSKLFGNQEGSSNGQSGRGVQGKSQNKPRATWRTREEIKALIEAGHCTRCKIEGHIGRFCPSHRPARRPRGDVSSVNMDEVEVDSRKDDP